MGRTSLRRPQTSPHSLLRPPLPPLPSATQTGAGEEADPAPEGGQAGRQGVPWRGPSLADRHS